MGKKCFEGFGPLFLSLYIGITNIIGVNVDRVLILNGPPRSGKDTLSDLIFKGCVFSSHIAGSFKRPLQEITSAILGMKVHDFLEQYEIIKDELCPNGLPLTVRQLMIKISEEWVKPIGGSRYFGDLAYTQALLDSGLASRYSSSLYDNGIPGHTVVFTDGGFGEECLPFVENLGAENVYIVRIHREGVTFDQDSRRYLTSDIPFLSKCKFFDVKNDGSLTDLLNGFKDIVVDQLRKDTYRD